MALVAIDLSAAFDTVDHTILLDILEAKYGIIPRSFKVVIDNKYSKPHDLEVSVPQGSCAGASIFNLYCSTLHEVIPSDLPLSGFADDHSIRRIFKAGSNAQEGTTIHSLQTCMLNIKSWMDAVRLKMNPSKTVHIFQKQATAQ